MVVISIVLWEPAFVFQNEAFWQLCDAKHDHAWLKADLQTDVIPETLRYV